MSRSTGETPHRSVAERDFLLDLPQDSSGFAYASGFERVRLWLKAQLFRKADSLNFPRWTLGKFIKEEHFLRYLEWC